MKKENTYKASIDIAGKSFPLNLTATEKSRLHSLEQEINNKINHYQSQFAHMSDKDSIALVLISYAFELKEAQLSGNPELVDQTLSQLESILDSSK